MGCEALQMGARRIFAIESNKETAKICKSNLISTSSNLNHKYFLEVISSEVLKALKKGCTYQSKNFNKEFPNHDYRFDFIYLDPPYSSDLYGLILNNILLGNWIKEDGLAICECSTNLIPIIPQSWVKVSQRKYGNNQLLFLTPNQALHYCDDIDSKLPQIGQE